MEPKHQHKTLESIYQSDMPLINRYTFAFALVQNIYVTISTKEISKQ